MKNKNKSKNVEYYKKKWYDKSVKYNNFSIEDTEITPDEKLCKIYDAMIIEKDKNHE